MSAGELSSPDGAPIVYAADREAWRAWLEAHHSVEPRVWVAIAKKGAHIASVTYDEAVEEALAFGWIDSRANRGDDVRYLQVFTRRRPKSVWSQSNRVRVARLLAEGRMAPAGLLAVDEAKRNGSWDAAPEDGANNASQPSKRG